MNIFSNDKTRRGILADNIKRYREEQHISRKELARYVGVTDLDIVHYEYCVKEPSASVVFAIAEYLNVNLYRLFMDDYEWFEYNL